MFLPVLIILLLYPCMGYAYRPCARNIGIKFEENPSDCTRYFMCSNSKPYPMKCGMNQIWNQKTGKCEKGARDSCFKGGHWPQGGVTPPTVEYTPPPKAISLAPWRFSKPVCTLGSKRRFAHPTRCAQYYDCGANPAEDWWGKHVRECPYPLLFNERYGQCDHYSRVRCRHREIPLDPCDYVANHCRTIQCQPCIMRFGSCKGLPNGLHPWKTRERTPYFLVCKDQRVVFHSRCLSPSPGFIFEFDPVLHTCLQPKDGYKFPK